MPISVHTIKKHIFQRAKGCADPAAAVDATASAGSAAPLFVFAQLNKRREVSMGTASATLSKASARICV